MDKRRNAATAVISAGTVVAGTVAAAGRRVTGMVAERLGAGGNEDPACWRVVTIYRPVEQLQRELPVPLTELGDAIEVQIRRAPGDKGTEVAVRLSPSRLAQEEDPGPAVEQLRTALRRAKQLAEVGWVQERTGGGIARSTPSNWLLQAARRHAGGEGRL